MTMPIASPKYSFVDFNAPITDCNGNDNDVALPAYDNFAIKFHIKVIDELLSSATILKAAVCSVDCDLLNPLPPDVLVIPTCWRYVIQDSGTSTALNAEDFPINVTTAPDGFATGSYSMEDFLTAVQDVIDENIISLDYISCCAPESLALGIDATTAQAESYTLVLGRYWGYGYVNFPAQDMNPFLNYGDCFRYCVLDESDNVLKCSNLFYRIYDPCYTTVFRYYNEENAFDFKYTTYLDVSTERITENQIRLSISFQRPTHPIEENIFRRSDNKRQRLSTLIDKAWNVRTAELSESQHDKLVIMLKHDYLHVQNDNKKLNGTMVQTGAVEYDFPDYDDYDVYSGTFEMLEDAGIAVNNNCGFNCGIEIIDPCDDGGVIPPCPDKYDIEFEVGAVGSPMNNGDTIYQDDNIIGKQDIEVYREGLIQYTMGANNYSFNSVTGTITFTPPVYTGERIAIWEV